MTASDNESPLETTKTGGPDGLGWRLVSPAAPEATLSHDPAATVPAPDLPDPAATVPAPDLPDPAATVPAPDLPDPGATVVDQEMRYESPPAANWAPPSWAPPTGTPATRPGPYRATPPPPETPGTATADTANAGTVGAAAVPVARSGRRRQITIIGLAAAAALVVVPLAASLLVGSLDRRDADRAELAFATADCGEVAARAEQIDGRIRPPWTDPPSLATFERGCAELTTALDGSPAEVVQALAELRTTTTFPSIETAANSRLKDLLASSDVVGNDGRLLCERVGALWDNRLITADDGPFALLRACGLARARDGDTGAELLRRAVQAARTSELDTLTEPEVVEVWIDAPATCGWLAEVSSLLGAAAPGKYASCGRAQLNTGRPGAGVNIFGDLVRLYPDSPEARALPQALQTEPAICSPLAGLDALPFTSSPDWFARHKFTCGNSALDERRWLEAEDHLNEAVDAGAETEAGAEAAALLDAMRPASGTLLGESTINRTGSVDLKLLNRLPIDVVVAVLHEDGRNLRFYVRGGEEAEIRSFPADTYKLLFVVGEYWLPGHQQFVEIVAVAEFGEPFDAPPNYIVTFTLAPNDQDEGDTFENLIPRCEDLRAAGLGSSADCI